MNVTRRGAALLAALTLGASRSGEAAEEFPNRPVRLIVPYPPGGAADLVTRLVAQHAAGTLRQPIVVENRAGANGMIGANAAAQAQPDGYTLVLATDGMYGINPHLLRPGTRDPLERLVPVIQLVSGPLLIMGRPNLPADTLPALIALARSSPGRLTYGANNVTSAHYLITQMLQRRVGIEMSHIAYAGTTAALPDLMGGRIDLLIGQPASTEGQAASGVKRIAVTSGARFPSLPDVPTVAETLPGFDQSVAFGIMAPAETPAEAIAAVNRAFDAALRNSAIQERILSTGAVEAGGGPERFGALIAGQKAALGRIIAELGLRPE